MEEDPLDDTLQDVNTDKEEDGKSRHPLLNSVVSVTYLYYIDIMS